jgi:hypothetical protein
VHRFDDPSYLPPAELNATESRQFEEAVLKALRDALPAGSTFGVYVIESIDLVGQRPDTVVAFTYHEVDDKTRRLRADASIWEIVEVWNGKINSAVDIGSSLYSSLTAHELEPQEIG